MGTTKEQTNSTYESVTDQAGIRAGQGGYDITVKGNTHLKGGLIDSSAVKDKNTLTTGTLTWEDMDNKADYSSQNKGQNLTTSWSPKVTDENNYTTGGHKTGISPVQSQPVKGKADSTTKSAISEGTITITDKNHQKQDVATLPRDTKNSLNQLEKIFDKDTIREQQELANEFAKLGAEKIGDIAKEKNWSPNDPRRTLLHGLLGGITAKLGGNSILAGSVSGATMEGLQPMLDTFLKYHPEMREEVASLIGYTTGKLFGGNEATGSAVAWNGTKFNWLNHEQYNEYLQELSEAKTQEEKDAIVRKYREINDRQDDEWEIYQPAGDYTDPFYGDIGKVLVKGKKDIKNSEVSWSNRMLSLIGITLAKDSIFNGLDYRVSNATGHIAPVGTLMNTVSSIVDDGDINKYGYYGAKRRILFDIATTGGELYLFRKAGLFDGILYSTIADIGLDKAKEKFAPQIPAAKIKESNRKEQEELVENGID